MDGMLLRDYNVRMTEPIRLVKRVAEMLPCSRHQADLYIEGGFVTVDGNVIDQLQFRVTDETVVLRPNAKLDPPEPVLSPLPRRQVFHKARK